MVVWDVLIRCFGCPPSRQVANNECAQLGLVPYPYQARRVGTAHQGRIRSLCSSAHLLSYLLAGQAKHWFLGDEALGLGPGRVGALEGTSEPWMAKLSLHGCIHGGPRKSAHPPWTGFPALHKVKPPGSIPSHQTHIPVTKWNRGTKRPTTVQTATNHRKSNDRRLTVSYPYTLRILLFPPSEPP